MIAVTEKLKIRLSTKFSNSKRIMMASVVLHNTAVSRSVALTDGTVLAQEVTKKADIELEQVGSTCARDRIIQRLF